MKYEIKNFVDYYTRQSIELNLAHNSKYTSYDFTRMCMNASLGNDSIEGVCLKYSTLSNLFPVAHTIRDQLKSKRHSVKYYLNVFDKLNNQIFQMAKKKEMLNKPVKVAIDFHDILYYGDKNDSGVIGTKPQKGTKWCHCFASVHIVSKGQRFCLKVLPVIHKVESPKIVRKLLEFALKVVDIKLVMCDRFFSNSVDIIKEIEKLNLKWLMAIQSKLDSSQVMFGLSDGKRIFDYTMRKGNTGWRRKDKINFTHFLIGTTERKDGFFHFATNLKVTEFNKRYVADVYRYRWGIETGYRVIDDFRIKTTTKSYKVRLFDYLLSSSVYNLWVLWNIMDKRKKYRSGKHIPTYMFKWLILNSLRNVYSLSQLNDV